MAGTALLVTATWLEATVVAARMATPDGRLLTLEVPGWPGSDAGQHVDVRLTAEDGYQAVRSYSLASYGSVDRIELAVDRLRDGEVSPYLVEDIMPGDRLEVKGPIGGYFVWRATQSEPVQLVAGGSGVVPLMAMIRAHCATHSDAELRLLYSVRTPAHAFFAEELTEAPNVRVDWVYTGTVGRIDDTTIATATIPAHRSPTVYVCGSNGFVERAAKLMVAAGHSAARIRTERYGG
jgi:ferredoxin-NADP reductase